jgi:ketosteroid isomerase-like protein
MGTHTLAGVYNSKNDFLKYTFKRLSRILKGGVVLKVNHILISDDIAIVEMTSRSTTLSGELWPNSYCWILRFENAITKEVRAYVDSYLIQKLIDEYEQSSLS